MGNERCFVFRERTASAGAVRQWGPWSPVLEQGQCTRCSCDGGCGHPLSSPLSAPGALGPCSCPDKSQQSSAAQGHGGSLPAVTRRPKGGRSTHTHSHHSFQPARQHAVRRRGPGPGGPERAGNPEWEGGRCPEHTLSPKQGPRVASCEGAVAAGYSSSRRPGQRAEGRGRRAEAEAEDTPTRRQGGGLSGSPVGDGRHSGGGHPGMLAQPKWSSAPPSPVGPTLVALGGRGGQGSKVLALLPS